MHDSAEPTCQRVIEGEVCGRGQLHALHNTSFGHAFHYVVPEPTPADEPVPADQYREKISSTSYQLMWEQVSPRARHLYCDADPNHFLGATQVKPNSAVQESEWVTMQHSAYSDQGDEAIKNILHHARTLKSMDGKEIGFVRNVSLKKYVTYVRECDLSE